MIFSKKILNFLVIIILTFITFWWTFFVFHVPFDINIVLIVIFLRMTASASIFRDYSLSWSKATQKTFLIKSIVYIIPFILYMPYYYQELSFSFFTSELFFYIFTINFSMYLYYFLVNRNTIEKTKKVVIFGAGKAGLKLEDEFKDSVYSLKYFVDDDNLLQGRTIDTFRILSIDKLKKKIKDNKLDLLVIAIPSASQKRIKNIYNELSNYFLEIKILPSLSDILNNNKYSNQLKDISVEDLLARHPADLDTNKISSFINDKVVLITGAGGSIGSEIVRQCILFKAKKLILIDHSEYNLYKIEQEVNIHNVIPIMINVVNKDDLENTFEQYKPDIVIHAAAYKHVPLVEQNIKQGIVNNIIGTKNVIDTSIKYSVKKVVLISTDKAVRPTNVMGTTKRICELYAQNSNGNGTDIVAVRFGNVLGSSGSVIPKFKTQIQNNQNITVTHKDITRYFMLIPEACELVLQAGAIGTGGEIFILNMGEPIKIVDLANKMIELSGKSNIKIEFSGLRPGEKLYEELLIEHSDASTQYESITVAKPSKYDINKLNEDINELINCEHMLKKLKHIVPEFNHKP